MKPLTGAVLAAGAVLLVAGVAEAAAPRFDYDAYRHAIGVHESSGVYDTVNSIGFIGKYQFGAAALTDLGYIKLSVYQQYPANDKNSALRDPNAWKAPYTRAGFLADGPEQERAMVRLTEMNRSSLVNNGILTKRSTAQEQGAWLAIAHGLGAGAANRLYRTGESKPDAYGTNAAQLYRIGSYSQRHPYALTAANKNAVKDGKIA